jgi:hypothetical protein
MHSAPTMSVIHDHLKLFKIKTKKIVLIEKKSKKFQLLKQPSTNSCSFKLPF